jgi:hypothetical protein
MNIPMKVNEKIFRNSFWMRNCWLFDSNYEFILKRSEPKFYVKKGINRIKVEEGKLKGDVLIHITVRVYGTDLELFIPPDTEAVYLYNMIASWMGQEPSRIRIQICKFGIPVEGMGHFLTSNDRLWDGVYNFNLFEAKVSKKRSDMANLGLDLEENVDVVSILKQQLYITKLTDF